MSAAILDSRWDELVKGQKGRFRPEWIPFLNDDRDNCVFLDTSQEPPPEPRRET